MGHESSRNGTGWDSQRTMKRDGTTFWSSRGALVVPIDWMKNEIVLEQVKRVFEKNLALLKRLFVMDLMSH